MLKFSWLRYLLILFIGLAETAASFSTTLPINPTIDIVKLSKAINEVPFAILASAC